MSEETRTLTRKQIRQREYRAKNRERIKAQRHEYYLRNREEIIRKNREYVLAHSEEVLEKMRERARQNWPKRSEKRKLYYQENIEKFHAKGRAYYQKNKDKLSAYNDAYRLEHRDEIVAKQRERKANRDIAKQMCPAFKFLEHMRVKHKEEYLAKYKPGSDLAHKARKTCVALQNGDYTMCPICNDCAMSSNQMEKVCPMPRVFEFENAAREIRVYVADIMLDRKK